MNLSEIEERLEKATPGPWTAGKNYAAVIAPATTLVCKGECDCNPTCNEMYGGKLIGESIERADAELIMHAPTDLAALVGEVKRLQSELASAKELAKFELCVDGFCTDGSGNVCFVSGKHYSWGAADKTRKVYHKEGE